MIATYVYRCEKCSALFELRRDASERDSVVPCPTCQCEDARRIFMPALTFSRGSDGAMRMISGGGCGGCAATRCNGCPSANN